MFNPEEFGLETIFKGGLESFSKTVQVQSDPCPPISKSIGLLEISPPPPASSFLKIDLTSLFEFKVII